MARPVSKLTAKAEACIRLEARGESHEAILRSVFELGEDADPQDIRKAEQQMYRWRHHPGADAIWQDEVRSYVRLHVPKAMVRIGKQVNDGNGWLANKAANDLLTLAKTAGVLESDEKALSVKIEGMPEIGSPDDDG